MILQDGVSALYLVVLLFVLSSIVSVLFYKKEYLANVLTNVGCMAASGVGFVLSLFVIIGKYNNVKTGNITLNNVPYLCLDFKIDYMGAFFMLIFSVITFLVSLYSIGYVNHYIKRKSITMFNMVYPLFLLSMNMVIASGNLIVFFIMWELMSLTSYFLVAFEAENNEVRDASTLYIIMTHIGTAFLMIAFTLLYVHAGSFDFEIIKNYIAVNPISSGLKNALFILFLIGFGTKAGAVPLHVWLPYAHPAAPGNVSALMSGIMLKTAIYGLVRFLFEMIGISNSWWGYLILIIGVISAVNGVAYAFFEKNIKKLLAYSSIENIGIILMGLGLCALGVTENYPFVAWAGMIAALLHTMNHAVFKSLLFLCAASIDYSTHTKKMDELGGLMKRMPYTGFLLVIGSLSISAIIPFNGFIGEWLTLQGFINYSVHVRSLSNIIAIIGVITIAFAGVLAAGAFIKLIGISFLGEARSDKAKNALEVPLSMRISKAILALLCLAAGVMPMFFLGVIAKAFGLHLNFLIKDTEELNNVAYFWSGGISFAGQKLMPAVAVISGLIFLLIIVIFFKIVGARTKIREYGTWDCGFIEINKRMQYTAEGFSHPLGWVLKLLYQPRINIKETQGSSPYYPNSIKYTLENGHIIEMLLYIPITKFLTKFSRKSRLSFQTGSMHLYLLYVFITVVGLIIYNKVF